MSESRRERRLALVGGHPLLVDLALEEVRDPPARGLAELVRDLAADGVVSGLDSELGDARAHGAEPDDADRADAGGRSRRAILAT